MQRLPWILLGMLFVTASFAGCFGGDDDKDDGDDDTTPPTNGNGGNNTTPPNNTTTTPPRVLRAPIPSYATQMSVIDDDGVEIDNQTGLNFSASPGNQVIFRFDGSNSTDPDGTIQAGSWVVEGPGGEFKAASISIRFNISNLKSTDFGVYQATLKVLDNDNVLNSTTFSFVLNYVNVFDQPGMNGAGQATCDSGEMKAGSPIQPNPAVPAITPGTFQIHGLTIGENATMVSLTLTFTATAPSQQVVMRLLPPGFTEASCAGELGSSGAGASPRTLVVTEGVDVAGAYGVRVDLVGADVDSYTIDVQVTYAAPAAADAGEEEAPA